MKHSQMFRLRPLATLPALLWLAFAAGAAPVQAGGISTDGSVGPAQTLSGPNFVIPQNLGKVVGNNLFQSFQTFGIDKGQSATFQASVSGNVISRVTGGAASEIHGKLALSASNGAPAFWFINPAGIVFGAGASIDVPGSFHAATADHVRFADGSRFYADPAAVSVFSSAAPEAFGFLGNAAAGKLTIRDGADLYNPNGSITLAGGDVRIETATLETAGGDIRIVALGRQAAEVAGTGALPRGAQGSLQIDQSEVLTNTGRESGGGSIRLAAGDIALTAARVAATTTGPGNAGDVSIDTGTLSLASDSFLGAKVRTGASGAAGNVLVQASGDVSVTGGSTLSSDTYGSGNAAQVVLYATNLTVDGSGSFLSSDTLGAGNAGGVTAQISGLTKVTNGAWISSDAYEAGNGGTVVLGTGRLAIDGGGTKGGISAETLEDSSGGGGWVNVTVKNDARLENHGRISTITAGKGNAGNVTFSAASLAIDGTDSGILSDAKAGSLGLAGYVSVATSGATHLSNGASISSSTQSSGHANIVELATDSLRIDSGATVASSTSAAGSAGNIIIKAGSIVIDGGNDSSKSTGIFSTAARGSKGNAGNITLTIKDALTMGSGAEISSDTRGESYAGDITIEAGTLTLDNAGIYSRTYSNSQQGSAGWVDLKTSGGVLLDNGSKISSSTYAAGDAGWVSVNAGTLVINGDSGIYSNALSDSTGLAGWVGIEVKGDARLSEGGQITSSTAGPGAAGYVSLEAGNILIDGGKEGLSGIFSTARSGSTGDAGWIEVTARDALQVINGARISTSTAGPGNAGLVKIRAGTLSIDNTGSAYSTGIYSASDTADAGNAGDIDIETSGATRLLANAAISSNTEGRGHAGNILLKAGSLDLDGSGIYSRTYSDKGYAGWVDVQLTGKLAMRGGSIISSSTYSGGEAGYVSVLADSIDIDASGIYSNAATGSWGPAGWVDVFAKGMIRLTNAGEIATNTMGEGGAGYVVVKAGSIALDGERSRIAARAEAGSSGQTGDVTITADSIILTNGGSITIANDASSAYANEMIPTALNIETKSLALKDASITANSTGNIAASNIDLKIVDSLRAERSIVSTSSAEGNGGAIGIRAGSSIVLDRSQITTSVSSLTNGNGGNIGLASRYLVLNTGMIQANTEAAKANGGDIRIEVTSLVPSNNSLLVGGSTPYVFDASRNGFNAIQAAAPDGVSGNIQITSPVLDLSGSLAGIQAQILQSEGLGRSPCDTAAGSTLATVGRGGLPPSARDALRADPRLQLTRLPGAMLDLGPVRFVQLNCPIVSRE